MLAVRPATRSDLSRDLHTRESSMTNRRKIIHVVPDRAIPQRQVGGWESIPAFVRKMGPAIVIALLMWYGIYRAIVWVLR